MKYLLILLLFPIFSYSQNIGEKIPLKVKSKMYSELTQNGTVYKAEFNDSTATIYTNSDIIYAIDYVVSYGRWAKNGLTWVTKYEAIGKNIFYDKINREYYFVVYTEGKFIIQVRNEDKISSL